MHRLSFAQNHRPLRRTAGSLIRSIAILAASAAFAPLPAALGQGVTLSVSPQQLAFENIASGATSAPQTVGVSATLPTTVTVSVSASSPWLMVMPSGPVNVTADSGNPTNLSVRVNAQSLVPGTYQGSFTIAVNQVNQITVSVSLSVAGASQLSATPGSVSFTAQEGDLVGSPAATTVQVQSSGGTLNYSLSATTQQGSGWLLISAASGTTGGPGFTISVSPGALAPGTYNGSILVKSTSSDDSVQISVTLTVNADEAVTVSPAHPPPFLFQVNGAAPPPQFLKVSSTGGPVAFNVSLDPPANWLVVSPVSGSAGNPPATLTLSVDPSGLAPGNYTTSLIVTPVNANPLPAVPIQLIVSNNPILEVSVNQLSFSAAFGGGAPAAQQFQVTAAGTGGQVGFVVSSNQTWLTFTTTGVTSSAVSVSVDPAGLEIGEHTGQLTLMPTNGDSYTRTVEVTLEVSEQSMLTAAPAALLFTHQIGQAPPQALTVQIASTGLETEISVSAEAASCGGLWLSAIRAPAMTPSVVTVTVNINGQQPGICSGILRVSWDSSDGPQSLEIPVTMAVSADPALRVSLSQGFGVITAREGEVVNPRTISLSSTDPLTQVSYNITSTSSGGPWLQTEGAGTTPRNSQVSFFTSSLPPGTYSGEIVITSQSLPNTSYTIPILLRILPNITVTVTPTFLTFEQSEGGSPPPSQAFTLTSSAEGATFSASITQIAGGDWLQLDRLSGAASGELRASILPNSLTQNSYTARVRLTFQNASTAPVDLTVILKITESRRISASTQSITFNHQTGADPPAAQSFTVSSSAGSIAFSVGTTSSGWLSASITQGTTPMDVGVSADPTGLLQGSYSGSVTITAAGVAGSPITVNVTLVVTGPPPPRATTVTNNASNVAGRIAPGELITIKGSFLGPAIPAEGTLFSVTPQNTVADALAGVRVLFDDIPGTPIYVSATQINVTVPYEVAGRLSVRVEVEYLGARSTPIILQLADAAPGIYTSNSTGLGQAAAINQNGTFNGAPGSGGAPADSNTVIAIYATGGGMTSPPGRTGSISPVTSLLTLPGTVRATIGGLPATVEFAGAAPGLVTGVLQFNLRPHANAHGNNLEVVIEINGITSPVGPTVAVR